MNKKTVNLKPSEKNAYYRWLWTIGKPTASRTATVDAATYAKFVKAQKGNATRNSYLASSGND